MSIENPPKFSKHIMNIQYTKKYSLQNIQAACLVLSKTWAGIVEYLPAKLFSQEKTWAGLRFTNSLRS